jgi:hypothetical protein
LLLALVHLHTRLHHLRQQQLLPLLRQLLTVRMLSPLVAAVHQALLWVRRLQSAVGLP